MGSQKATEKAPATQGARDARPAARPASQGLVALPPIPQPFTQGQKTPPADGDRPIPPPSTWNFEQVSVHPSGRERAKPSPRRDSSGPAQLPSNVDEVLRSPGSPLDPATRQIMERALGADFASVRIHTDARAAASTGAWNAAAIASGSHILFAPGAYRPHDLPGRALLAHELVHVVQHRRARSAVHTPFLSRPQDAAERQADRIAHSIAAGGRPAAWSPHAPASQLSLAPNTWYRGFAVGVKQAQDGKVVHDLGGGVYFTDTADVAQTYASLRSDGNAAAERVIGGAVDPHTLGPVYDLREDKYFMTMFEHVRKTGPVSGERYRPMVESALKVKGKKIEDFAVIIGPEGVRGGTQMVVRDPQAAQKIIGSMATLPGRGDPSPGAAGGLGGPPPAGPPGGPPAAGGGSPAPQGAPLGKMGAMTPEDMYNKMIATRGFDEHVPVSQLDDVKKQLTDMEAELKKNPTPDLQRNYNKLLSRYNISTLDAPGGAAGTGYNTYAVVQVVGPDGNIIAVADGKYTGGLHAEQVALRKLDAQFGGQPVAIKRIDVVSDQVVCPEVCVVEFQKFSEKYKVGKVESYVFRRGKASGSGLTTPKTAARTMTSSVSEGKTLTKQQSTIVSRTFPNEGGTPGAGPDGAPVQPGAPSANMADHVADDPGGPPLAAARRAGAASELPNARPLGAAGQAQPRTPAGGATGAAGAAEAEVPKPPAARAARAAGAAGQAEEDTEAPGMARTIRNAEGEESVVGGAAKSALKGAAVSIGIGFLLAKSQQAMRQMVLDDIAALPQPKPDSRSALEYLRDPATGKGANSLDVLTKNLASLPSDLQTQQTSVTGSRFAQLMAVALLPEKTPEQYEVKLRQLEGIQNALDAWESELLTIDSNLDAILDMESQLTQVANSARSMHRLFSTALAADEMLKHGFEYEDWVDLLFVLDQIANRADQAIANARADKLVVRRMIDETADFDHQVNQIWWNEFGGQVGQLIKNEDAKRRQAQQQSMLRTKARYGTLEGLDPMPVWNSDQLGMWYYYKTREGEILFQINELTKNGVNTPEAMQRKIGLEDDLQDVHKKMMELRTAHGGAPPAAQ
jgi:hypothetical protein